MVCVYIHFLYSDILILFPRSARLASLPSGFFSPSQFYYVSTRSTWLRICKACDRRVLATSKAFDVRNTPWGRDEASRQGLSTCEEYIVCQIIAIHHAKKLPASGLRMSRTQLPTDVEGSSPEVSAPTTPRGQGTLNTPSSPRSAAARPSKSPKVPAMPKTSPKTALKRSPKASPKGSAKGSAKGSPMASPKASPKGPPKASPKARATPRQEVKCSSCKRSLEVARRGSTHIGDSRCKFWKCYDRLLPIGIREASAEPVEAWQNKTTQGRNNFKAHILVGSGVDQSRYNSKLAQATLTSEASTRNRSVSQKKRTIPLYARPRAEVRWQTRATQTCTPSHSV